MKCMKHLMAVLMAFLLMAAGAMTALAAAGGDEGYAFTYKEKQYRTGMEAKEAMDSLGEAVSSRDVNNCANGYVNKAYMYGDKDFEVYIEQVDGKETVTNITLLTDKAATEEGLKVGDSEAAVAKAYKDAKKGLGSYSAKRGGTKLYIKMKSGKVSYISYMMVQEK